MRARVLVLAVLSLALVAALGGVAFGQILPETTTYTTADECFVCHQGTGAAVSKVDFGTTGPVNYTKCKACHYSLPQMGHYHFGHALASCKFCHKGTSARLITFPEDASVTLPPAYASAFGYFTGAASLDASAAQLHEIHASSGWVERVLGDTLSSSGTRTCSTCHAAAGCTACHDAPPAAHTDHAVTAYPAVSVKTATGTAVSYAPATCINPACHDLAKAGTAGFTPECGSCHPAKTTPHGYIDVDHVANDGITAEGFACSACHNLDLATAHGDPTAVGSSCATCHPTPRDSFAAWDQSCTTGGCHTAGSTAPMHADTAVSHAVSAGNALCLDCHTGTELASIHATALDKTTGATSCFVCHTGVAGEPATSDCTSCHFTFANHYDDVKHTSSWAPLLNCAGSGCHAMSGDLMTVHEEHRTEAEGAFTCDGCHSDFSVAVQIEAGLTGCGDCHTNIYATSSHRDAHAAVPPLANDDLSPNYSYNDGSVGTMPTGDCAGCHTSNLVDEHMGLYLAGWLFLPRLDSTGTPLTCDTCHGQPEGSAVKTAITSGLSACESCHPVHGPIQDVHASTFVDAPASPCADCHDANIANEHNGTYTSSAGLSGCDVCHALYAGEMGVTVQTAISGTNDTRCSACHASYHTNTAAHTASSTASLACGTCHAPALTTIDVTAVHASAAAGPCKVCHASTRIGEISGHNAECASCHAAEGTDYHDNMALHVAPGSSGCQVTGCHHTEADVRDIHDGCATCHADASDPGKTTACSNCHGPVEGTDFHLAFAAKHEPTDAASTDCAGCHDTTDVTALHVTNGCDTCHYNEVGCSPCHSATMLHETAACATCHTAEGTDYHSAMDTSHTFTGMGASCTVAGCHVANTLPEEHERFIAEFGYTSTCDLCHENTTPGRILAGATADCSSCHEVHGDIATIHTATASQACVDCHETADVRELHGASADASCAVCHSAPAGRIDWTSPSIECTYCHGPASAKPLDPADHYPTAAHNATAETGCNQCHYTDMKAEHFKSTVAVTCVQCHEVKVDAFTTAWDKTCAACHATNHGDRAVKHTSTTATCAGTGCHVITDVAAIHGVVGGPGCGACHVNAATPATTTTCTDAGCHPSVGTNHHEAHNAASANPSGCSGCHFMYLDDEHAALGYTCDTCHKSTVAAVTTAIATGDVRCKSCHPTMHSAQDWEFNPARASVHRVSAELPGMRSSFVVNGSTYTMSLPAASTFLKAGWTTSSMMTCADCHSYSGATGPHGATMKVNIDPAYPNPYKVTTGSSTFTAQLSPNSPTGMSMRDSGTAAAGIICEKCHDLYNGSWSNVAHKEHDDRGIEGAYCNQCHIGVPHGWSRPRMLGYVTDAAPYATWGGTTQNGGLSRISLKSYTPNGWGKSDCGAACSSSRHPLSGSSWPATDVVAPTTGDVSGTVKNSSGTAISSATVSIGGKTMTTSSTGTYSITGITGGTYTMTVSATGYNTWSGSVTITNGSTFTQNVTLAASTTSTYGAVSGKVTNSSGSAVSGATVSIGGKTATASSDGTYGITGVVTGTYTMSVSASGYNTWSGSVTITGNTTTTQNVTLTAPTTTNLARNGTATASSTDGSNYPSKAIDGRTDTYWRSGSGGTQWLRVDLGSAKTFGKVVVNWYESRYAKTYRIETSNDGSNWTSRYSTSSGNGGIVTLTFAPVTARYVRVYCTQTNDSNYRITEFEVWGY